MPLRHGADPHANNAVGSGYSDCSWVAGYLELNTRRLISYGLPAIRAEGMRPGGLVAARPPHRQKPW
jgi:hypothetical protein